MTERLCVAMIMRSYYPRIGGAERQVGTIAPLLQAHGVSIRVITPWYPGMSSYDEVEGVAVHRVIARGPKPIAWGSFLISCLERLRRLEPDVIHAHELFSPTATAIVAKMLLGIPIVATAHSTGANGDIEKLKHKRLGRQWIAIYRKQVDQFACINRAIDADLAGVDIPAERRVLIPNGVCTRHFSPPALSEKQALRASFGLAHEAPIVIYTGRLVPSKRVDLLIAIWPAVRAKYPNAQLVIVGDGPEQAALRRAAGSGVCFTGVLQDVAPWLQLADLFVLPSAQEGLSVSILEAMAVGLPVIATAVGGNPGLITNGENGCLVPANDPVALQMAVLALLSDGDCRAKLGRTAREHAVRNYELEVGAQRLYELYQRIRKKRKSES